MVIRPIRFDLASVMLLATCLAIFLACLHYRKLNAKLEFELTNASALRLGTQDHVGVIGIQPYRRDTLGWKVFVPFAMEVELELSVIDSQTTERLFLDSLVMKSGDHNVFLTIDDSGDLIDLQARCDTMSEVLLTELSHQDFPRPRFTSHKANVIQEDLSVPLTIWALEGQTLGSLANLPSRKEDQTKTCSLTLRSARKPER